MFTLGEKNNSQVEALKFGNVDYTDGQTTNTVDGVKAILDKIDTPRTGLMDVYPRHLIK